MQDRWISSTTHVWSSTADDELRARPTRWLERRWWRLCNGSYDSLPSFHPPLAVPTCPLFTRPSLCRLDGRRRALSAFVRCHVRRPRYNNNTNLYPQYIRTVFVYAPKGCTVLIKQSGPCTLCLYFVLQRPRVKKYQVDNIFFFFEKLRRFKCLFKLVPNKLKIRFSYVPKKYCVL